MKFIFQLQRKVKGNRSPLCIQQGGKVDRGGWNNDENFTITISAYLRLMMRRQAEAELLLLLVAFLNVGIFSSTVIDAPVIRPRRQCVGSVKAYQVKNDELI